MDKIKELTTLEEVQVFSVPYRIKILDCMYSFKAPATVKNIADKMGETPAKIHYHVKKMEQAGIVHLVYTENINGIIAKFYEPTAEQFQINHKEGMDKDKFKMLNQAQRAISSIYDENKKNFLEQLAKADKRHYGIASGDDIYLTQEEFLELQKDVENIFKKYSSKAGQEGKIKYKAFFSIIGSE